MKKLNDYSGIQMAVNRSTLSKNECAMLLAEALKQPKQERLKYLASVQNNLMPPRDFFNALASSLNDFRRLPKPDESHFGKKSVYVDGKETLVSDAPKWLTEQQVNEIEPTLDEYKKKYCNVIQWSHNDIVHIIPFDYDGISDAYIYSFQKWFQPIKMYDEQLVQWKNRYAEFLDTIPDENKALILNKGIEYANALLAYFKANLPKLVNCINSLERRIHIASNIAQQFNTIQGGLPIGTVDKLNMIDTALHALYAEKLKAVMGNSSKWQSKIKCAAFVELLWDNNYFIGGKKDRVKTCNEFAKQWYSTIENQLESVLKKKREVHKLRLNKHFK